MEIDARGRMCPEPVILTKKAIDQCAGVGFVRVRVDNETAVNNISKLAASMLLTFEVEKQGEHDFSLLISLSERQEQHINEFQGLQSENAAFDQGTIIVISSDHMGTGKDELGIVLMKGFLYALTQLQRNPSMIIFYNSGAVLACKGSDSLEDLRYLEAQGVEILTCGTCLDYYGLTDALEVGSVTNMYIIAEKLMNGGRIIRP